MDALVGYLRLLQSSPDGENHSAEIKQAYEALGLANQMRQRENVEKILGALYQNGYEPEHVLFRVTIDDFAARLAERLARDHRTPDDLPPGELETLLVSAADYLNGEGMPWADVIDIALDEEWPFIDEDDNPEKPEI
jgi:hypothetical protein